MNLLFGVIVGGFAAQWYLGDPRWVDMFANESLGACALYVAQWTAR